ncbi:GEVED domain-containing protein [Lacinutrix gracilariae]|uniref:GEVED domain-containing protein n=2 Tax=Lacinutrix gracilariae TaxID=1747198 RepID=A0ABW5JZP9_9FLAO
MKKLLYKKNKSKVIDYKLLLLIVLVFSYNPFTNAQTTHISPTGNGGFELGATFATNGWNATTGGANQNQWVCDTGATTGFSDTRAAYISNARNSNPPPHAYTNTATRVTHLYRNITIPNTESNITLNFDWICNGEGIYDRMRIWLVPTTYNPTYGNQINANGTAPTGRVQVGGNFSEQYTWTNSTYTIPTAYAGNTFRLVFEWRNDGNSGQNPPIGIDNISLISDMNSSYCTPAPSSVDGLGITNVSFDIVNNTTGSEPGNYGDYSALIGTAVEGTTLPVNITYSTGYTYDTTIWVDWNDDFDFTDAGETVYNGVSLAANPTTLAASITIPAGAATSGNGTGLHRMRIGGKDFGPTNDPCYTGTYASYEDYTLLIVEPGPPAITSLSSSSGCEGSSFTINGTNLTAASSVTIGGTAATITSNTANSITATVGAGTTGTVTVITGGGSASSITSFTVNPLPTNPANPTSNSPQCNPAGVTITRSGTPPAGITWFWQTTANGTTTTDSGNTYITNTSGTYYLRARNNTTGCWSAGSGVINVTVNNPISSLASSPSPANNAATVCYSGTNAITSLNWNAAANAINYDVYFGTNATPAFVSNVTTTIYNIGALTPNTTYYWRIVPYGPCGISSGTPITWSFTTTNAPCLCTPSSTNSSNYIDDFSTTNGITNITNNNTGYTTGGYADYTSMIASQAPGGNITFSADFIYGVIGMGVGIWVDWNNDGDFNDLNEQIYNSAGYISNLNFSYTIPGVAAGTYRVRILADYWATSPDPCAFDTYGPSGEAEDYSITITPLNCTDDPISLTATPASPTTGTINWTAPSPAPANGYEYIVSTDNSTSTPAGDIIGTTTGTTVNLTGLTAGTTYYVFVRGLCNAVDFGIWVNTTFTTSCSNIITTPTVCPLIVGEQGVDPFTADPFDPDPSFSLDCSNPTLTLQAHSTIRETDSYIVEQIAYPNPAPEYEFPTFGGSGAQTITDDDVWADTRTNIGFNFCFYGNTYSETLVGANGMITFDSSYTPGSSCGYAFNDNLPSLVGALFNNTIYGVYHDIDPRGLSGTPIKSRVLGSPGCRQFIISWIDIPMFGDASRLYTGMIVLHETTNIIEVFIEEKRIENGDINPWNDGNAIVGLQGDANAGEAITAPCRNGLDTNWETTNEAWRFVPNGAIITPDSVEWFSASTGSTVIGTGSTLEISTPDTYTAEVTYTSCGTTTTFTDDVVVDQSSKTWMGYIDNNWYVDGNWEPNGVPTSSDCVLIPDVTVSNFDEPIADIINLAPLPPQPAYALNLTVAPTANLEIASGTNLVVTDWIALDGSIDIRDSGSLIQITDGATNVNNNTGSGAINMQRTANITSSYDYVYWSSPVEGFNVTNVSPGSTLIYEWISTIPGNGVGNYGNWQATTEPMINGKGYIIRNVAGTPTPSTPEFVGKPNNGVITKAITRGSYDGTDYTGGGNTIATRLDDNWNLVGNPYPSAISANSFITANASTITDDVDSSISGTIYLWRHLNTPSNAVNDPFYDGFVYNYNPNDYIAYNSTGSNPSGFGGDIAAGQAFFVLMEHTAPINSSVTFNNTMRNETLNNSQFYKTNEDSQQTSSIEKHRIWLDLIAPDNSAYSVLVGYIEGATNTQDRLYDGFELSENNTRFYSLINDNEFAIQGKAVPFQDTDTVPLGIEIPQNGNYTIAINNLDGLFETTNQSIFIEDTYTNNIHNLRVNPYSFNINAGTYNDRFILRYTDHSLSTTDFDLNALEILAPNNNYIKVKSGNSTIESVIVYDLLGRNLSNNQNINAKEFTITNFKFAEGAYIVKATLVNQKQKIQKVILKH